MPIVRKNYTTRQAAAALGIDDKTLLKWMTILKNVGIKGMDKATNPKDRRLRLVSRQQLEILSKEFATPLDDSAVLNPAPRHTPSIATILQDLDALRLEIEHARHADQDTPPTVTPAPPRRPASVSAKHANIPQLPLDWISIQAALRLHQLPSTTVRRNRADGRFPYHHGDWLQNGQVVEYALDPQEYEAFKAYYRTNPAYKEVEQVER